MELSLDFYPKEIFNSLVIGELLFQTIDQQLFNFLVIVRHQIPLVSLGLHDLLPFEATFECLAGKSGKVRGGLMEAAIFQISVTYLTWICLIRTSR